MTVRRHLITGEPILFAPERAGRPNAFAHDAEEACPFCPGNESETPPEISHAGEPWRVRVFPNKYPAVPGHEVIVESRRHEDSIDTLSEASEVVRMWSERYRAHADAAYVSLFKNEGERAGASIDHLHSQLIPLSFIPPHVERQLASFATRQCPLCATVANKIDENDLFTRFAPEGSRHVYEQWIAPKRHASNIAALTDAEIDALATILQRAIRATRKVGVAFNMGFMNFPTGTAAHFYIEVFPRLTPIAGFELATGTYIDIIDPAAAARILA